PGQQLLPGGMRVVRRREYGREIVARVARLAGGEVGVVEVEVADERTVVERSTVGGSTAAADQCTERTSAEIVQLRADRADGWSVEGAKSAAQRIEDADLQLVACSAREIGPGPRDDEARQPRGHCHRER